MKKAIVDKDKNEKSSTPGIQNFFKSAPKSLIVCKNDKLRDDDHTHDIYVELLKQKLQGKRLFVFSNIKTRNINCSVIKVKRLIMNSKTLSDAQE